MIARLATYEWRAISDTLDAEDRAILPGLLTERECAATTDLYADDSAFRSRVVMARHGFGRGEYLYSSYPLPSLIAPARPALYARIVPIANRWSQRMGIIGAQATLPERRLR